MAILKDLLVTGSARIKETIHGSKLNISDKIITNNLDVNQNLTIGGGAVFSWNSSKNAIQISFPATPPGPYDGQ